MFAFGIKLWKKPFKKRSWLKIAFTLISICFSSLFSCISWKDQLLRDTRVIMLWYLSIYLCNLFIFLQLQLLLPLFDALSSSLWARLWFALFNNTWDFPFTLLICFRIVWDRARERGVCFRGDLDRPSLKVVKSAREVVGEPFARVIDLGRKLRFAFVFVATRWSCVE